MQDRTDEALEAIRRYRGKRLARDDPAVQSEYRSIKGALLIEHESKTDFMNVLTGRDRSGHLKRLLLGCGGQFMQVSYFKSHRIIASGHILTEFLLAIRWNQRSQLLLHYHPDQERRTRRDVGPNSHWMQRYFIHDLLSMLFLAH